MPAREAAPRPLLTILGPTASGKTRLAVALARRFDGEIISADSRQVYRGLDIGTGKDLEEYGDGEDRVPAHLVDLINPPGEFSVFEFRRRFDSAFDDIHQRGRLPILCGGTGLYLDAVLRQYRMAAVPENPDLRRELATRTDRELADELVRLKPRLHNTTDLETRDRTIRAIEILLGERNRETPGATSIRFRTLGLAVRPDTLRERIKARLRKRLDDGLVNEARRLADIVPLERFADFGIEYKHLARLLRGEVDLDAFETELIRDIARFAKHQRTWFRKMERQGVEIEWVDNTEALVIIPRIASWLGA